jgi:tetratricopeptide (TPR) repeat protein
MTAPSRITPKRSDSIRRQANSYSNRGNSYRLKGDHDRAIADLNEAIRLDPKYTAAYSNRGNAYYSKADYDHAIADYTEAIRLDPKYATAYSSRGNAYYSKADYDHATADYTEVIRLNPKSTVTYNSRGNAYLSKGNYDRAMADYSEAIRLDPKYATAFSNRGDSQYRKGDYDRALLDLDEAIRLNPRYAIAYNNRGNAYNRKGDHDHAMADYSEAIRLDPKYAVAYNGRASVFNQKGNGDRALADLDEAIRLNPKYAVAYNGRGFAFKQKGELDRAIRDLDEAIRLDPKLAAAYSNRGAAHRQKRDMDRAIADLSEAIRLDPNITPAYTDRGLAYEQKGDPDLARLDFLAALERRTGTYTTIESALATARARLAALGGTVPEPARRQASQPPELRPAVVTGRRVALVIGNDRYPNLSADAQLANATNDARAVKRTLEGLGFEVLYGENLDRRAFVDKLSDLTSRLDKDAIALFYFAGHGVAFSGANYLLPSDIPRPRPTAEGRGEEARLADQAIAEAQVIERITDSGARVAIAVLDACRDNPLRSSTVRSLGSARGLAQSPPAEGLFSIYSAGFGQQALDRLGPEDHNPNSVFTRVFIEKLKTPGLDLQAVATETRRGVVALAKKIGHSQFPAYYDQITGDVYLAGLPAGVADVAPPPAPPVAALPASPD